MDPKWIWILGIAALVFFLAAVSRHRPVPEEEDRFLCPRCRKVFDVSPAAWAFAPKRGDKALLSCPGCKKRAWLAPIREQNLEQEKAHQQKEDPEV